VTAPRQRKTIGYQSVPVRNRSLHSVVAGFHRQFRKSSATVKVSNHGLRVVQTWEQTVVQVGRLARMKQLEAARELYKRQQYQEAYGGPEQ